MPSSREFQSWGRTAKSPHQVYIPSFADQLPALISARGASAVLGVGCGRSYGDSCLNSGNILIHSARLRKILAFDRIKGTLKAQAGVPLRDILDLIMPYGFVLPVVPGTSEVTVAGAVANDIHGKDSFHHGTFGRWVRRIKLLRSDGTALELSADENVELFQATIAGLGLTGIIEWVELALLPIPSGELSVKNTPFRSLPELWRLWQSADPEWQAHVAWLDLSARPRSGIFSVAKPASRQTSYRARKAHQFRLPSTPALKLVNRCTAYALSLSRHIASRVKPAEIIQDYRAFHFPLDRLANANLVYGRRGFYQYQCVVPQAACDAAIEALVDMVLRSRHCAPLAVIKRFSGIKSPGMLTFPMPGTTLAVDFPDEGSKTLDLMTKLDSIVVAAGGRLYPAKDARMPPDVFQATYPQWREFARFVDPACRSDFWARVTGP